MASITYFTHCSGVSIVDFEQGNAGWEPTKMKKTSEKKLGEKSLTVID